jgi:hypothetical protein
VPPIKVDITFAPQPPHARPAPVPMAAAPAARARSRPGSNVVLFVGVFAAFLAIGIGLALLLHQLVAGP